MTLSPGAGYTVIGGEAAGSISDAPPPAPGGVIVSWAFDTPPFTSGSVPPSSGTGTFSTTGWGGTIDSFSGINGTPSIALQQGTGGNGTYLEISFSAAGRANLGVSYWTR